MEPIAAQPARERGDDGPRLCQGLETRCQIRRLPDHRMLLRGPLADE
jgi:hypothetical protein